MPKLRQTKILHPMVAIEDQDLYDAIEAEIAIRAGGAARAKTGGAHDLHLADLIVQALRAHLLAPAISSGSAE